MKNNTPLDMYDDMPKSMKRYLAYNGWHFNKAAYDFAASHMMKKNDSGKLEPVRKLSKEQVDTMLAENGVKIENQGGWDYVYVAMMCKADMWGSSIEDDLHMARYIKDTCDDADVADGTTMRRWFATMTAAGIGVPWEDIL